MKHMKKILFSCLMVVMLTGITACGNTGTNNATDGTNNKTTTDGVDNKNGTTTDGVDNKNGTNTDGTVKENVDGTMDGTVNAKALKMWAKESETWVRM